MSGDDRHHRGEGQAETGGLEKAGGQQIGVALTPGKGGGPDRAAEHPRDDEDLSPIESIGEPTREHLRGGHRHPSEEEEECGAALGGRLHECGKPTGEPGGARLETLTPSFTATGGELSEECRKDRDEHSDRDRLGEPAEADQENDRLARLFVGGGGRFGSGGGWFAIIRAKGGVRADGGAGAHARVRPLGRSAAGGSQEPTFPSDSRVP